MRKDKCKLCEVSNRVIMEKLRRSRRPVRTQLTRILNEIQDMLQEDAPDQRALRVSSDLLDKALGELEVLDIKIQEQMAEEGASDDIVDKEYQSIEDYRRSYLNLKTELDDFWANTTTSAPAPSEGKSINGDGRKRKFHLPEVKLKSFGGNLKEWLGWWSQFEKIHLDEELHDTDKFQYLAQAMETGTEARDIVESYPQTEGNYSKAVEALKDRFGRQDLLLQVYVRELLTLVIGNVTKDEKLPLPQLFVRLESHLRCLTVLNLDKADPATWLYPLVESSLSEETLRAWQRSIQCKTDGASTNPPKSRLDLLMDFIKSEVQCEQQIALARQGFQSKDTSAPSTRGGRGKVRTSGIRKSEAIPTAAGLLNMQTGCGFCSKPHETDQCFRAQRMTLKQRMNVVRENRLCFQCLTPGHVKRNCTKSIKCPVCSRRHYQIMCSDFEKKKSEDPVNSKSIEPPVKRRRNDEQCQEKSTSFVRTFQQNSNQCSRAVLLNTLKVKLRSPDGKFLTVRLVGDNGSQRSYATGHTLSRVNCLWIEDEWLQNVLFGGELTPPKKFPRHEVTIYGINGGEMTLELLGKDQITGEIREVPRGQWIEELSEQGITFSDLGNKATAADILIGNDYWGAIRTGRIVKLSCGLVAEETVFGWTLGGRLPVSSTNMVATTMTVSLQDIEKLWSLEALGIQDPVQVRSAQDEEKMALEHFSNTVKRDADGRYVVSLPWKEADDDLPSNRKVAEQRLKSTTLKLMKTNKLHDYHNVFVGWEKEGLIVQVKDKLDSGHYIPHRPVFKESTTTPVRPVFDASCRQGRSPSLNDCLYKGPNLIELIPAMLLRFGKQRIGVSADIRKAFQMLKVTDNDQPFQRFLWWEDESCRRLVVYQHTRVVFGITSSPFLLGAALLHLIDSVKDRNLAAVLKTSFYVDNLITSLSSLDEYERFRISCTEVLADAKMVLRQWACSTGDNDESTTAPVMKEATNGEMFFNETIMPVLGVSWNRATDTLSVVIKSFQFENVTKRNILSVIAQVFDPVGYLCPALVPPKCLVQEAWSTKLGWDTPVPHEVEKKFLKWNKELISLNELQVPRFCQMLDATSYEVHVFSDSSKDAMAAVAFLRTEKNGEVAVQFLLAKSRLTPVKKPTIPRSELVGCVIGVRVGMCVREALELEKDQFTFWSDSATALAWIRRSGDWEVFVKNRVKEILRNTDPHQWRHVPGSMNPADLPSRGCSPNSLLKSKWWEGPNWLRSNREMFPDSKLEPDANEEDVVNELKKVAVAMSNVVCDHPKFSSYRKNVAVLGWVLRFIDGCRRKKLSSEKFLKIGELRRAEKFVVKEIQRNAFPHPCSNVGGISVFQDDDGILRVKTRLGNREDTLDFITPILLPKSHPLVEMLIRDIHLYHGHGGIQFLISKLREKYWIVQSRRVVRKVLRKCVACSRHTVKNLNVDPAALPAGRVEAASVFSTTGVDLAGPLFLKDGKKAWVVLYTCALYRAVHLDLIFSLSTETFLRSLERFISQFGRPNTIYSDNGTNFVGSANLFKKVNWIEIQQKCGVNQIQWIFNPPTAAWWGGWWERLVRSVKDLLKRMLGRSKLSEDELRTCLAGVTATINDRPLTCVTEDDRDLVPLTPSMFIRSPKMGHFPDLSDVDNLQKSYRKMKDVQSRLQHRFRKEYLAHLVTMSRKNQHSSIAVGDVVLVGSDNRRRFEWPLGVVKELLPGKDGKVRVTKVKTPNGIITRPLQRLFPLEVTQEKQSQLEQAVRVGVLASDQESSCFTRSGRKSKRPVRYGQWMYLVHSGTG